MHDLLAPAIEVADLTQRSGPVPAVDRLSLSVPPGTSCGIAGPNDAAKTTTLTAIRGLLELELGVVAPGRSRRGP
ncbi:hypothetical protein HCN51_15915 [Nonomuraea sp. FMUSA5-5]|uniref:ATP-binding cassette domain-containing protein n=1 Tax=Nonomuraea composti TaxID=2720023 RepID=A0ABX1B373_9ACTN|nr:hypothetical protein [Nonomuraea sp. FMUSA5-5]NJP90927.1 hypothetical protein [Nonomuraea sp. FMUSA5-5]